VDWCDVLVEPNSVVSNFLGFAARQSFHSFFLFEKILVVVVAIDFGMSAASEGCATFSEGRTLCSGQQSHELLGYRFYVRGDSGLFFVHRKSRVAQMAVLLSVF
jgi:hypothetical protein